MTHTAETVVQDWVRNPLDAPPGAEWGLILVMVIVAVAGYFLIRAIAGGD